MTNKIRKKENTNKKIAKLKKENTTEKNTKKKAKSSIWQKNLSL